MYKGKPKKAKSEGGPIKPRGPVLTYSGSGFHTSRKYGKYERRAAKREVELHSG